MSSSQASTVVLFLSSSVSNCFKKTHLAAESTVVQTGVRTRYGDGEAECLTQVQVGDVVCRTSRYCSCMHATFLRLLALRRLKRLSI